MRWTRREYRKIASLTKINKSKGASGAALLGSGSSVADLFALETIIDDQVMSLDTNTFVPRAFGRLFRRQRDGVIPLIQATRG
jgi:4-diphosphocytidyl-2C-methyl-D-erythritol kinase